MFHWICPECGREIAPAMKECSFCDASAAVAAPPPLPAVAQVAVAEVIETAAAPVKEAAVAELPERALERVIPERTPEHKDTHDPLRAAAEQLRSLQAQAHANAVANGVNGKVEAKAKAAAEAKAKAETEARQVEEARREGEAKAQAEAKLEVELRAQAEAKAEAEARQAAEATLEAEMAEAEAKAAAEARQAEEATLEAERAEAEAKAAAEARQAAEAKLEADRAEAEAKAAAEARQAEEAKLEAERAEAEAKAAAEARQAEEAKLEAERAEAEAKAAAEARQAEEAKLEAERAEAEAKAAAEARQAEEAKLEAERAEAEAKAAAEARQAAEAKLEAERAEAEAKAAAEAQQAAEVKLETERAEAEAKAAADAKLGAKARAEAEAKAKLDAEWAEVERMASLAVKSAGPPALPMPPAVSLQLESTAPTEATTGSMFQDLSALASINEPGVAPEQVESPLEVPQAPESLVPAGFTTAAADAAPSTTPLAPLQMGLLQSSPGPVGLLAPPELEVHTPVAKTAPVEDPLPQMQGLASRVDVPGMKPIPVVRPAVFSEPVAPLPERAAAPPAELAASVAQQTLPPPSFSLAGREGHPSSVAARLKPLTSKPKVVTSESAPQFHLPGPSIPPQLVSVSEAGLTAAPIGKMGFRQPKKAAGTPVKGGTGSVKGWLVSLSVMTAMLAVGGGVIYWAIPSQTLASVKNSGSKAEPETTAPAAAVPDTPQTPTNSLSKQIEVTGFRFVTPANKKPEIHYLVVNHSALALNDVTIYVTLHSANAKPGQPPLSRFSFRAPNVAPYESKEMASTIEKVTQPMALPDWQDVKVEVSIGQ